MKQALPALPALPACRSEATRSEPHLDRGNIRPMVRAAVSHEMNRQFGLLAGAGVVDITPEDSQFLYGYPHVRRYSTGVHDRLLSSALYLRTGGEQVLFIANDVIGVSKASARRVREAIAGAAGVPSASIMVTATHTHSGPKTTDYVGGDCDPVVPKTDPKYLRRMEEGIIGAGVQACRAARPAELGLAIADGSGLGTNRRDPSGPADPQVPVLFVRSAQNGSPIAAMAVCSMHPTVLHEGSTLISGDFPGLARQYLQGNALGPQCPVLFHTGLCGNQSPRHVVRANTFEEAGRLGDRLGNAIANVLPQVRFFSELGLGCMSDLVDLPRRTFPAVEQAQLKLGVATERLERLRQSDGPRQEVRTAECDWFGAEECLALARAARDGRLDEAYACCLPAEIQIISVGPWKLVGWPGEVFVEYALEVKSRRADTFVISLANGGLQGYIVTPEASAEGGYEASNGLFPPEAGTILVESTLRLLEPARPPA